MNSETPPFTLQPLRPSELTQAASARLSWLWHGYLAPGKVTALVSPPKVGKTTLLSHVLARMGHGGQLTGLSQQAILDLWPVEGERPDRSTLSRWLKRAARQSLVGCSGSGYRGAALVYWLPGREPLLWPGDHASAEEKQAWRLRYVAYASGLNDPPGSA